MLVQTARQIVSAELRAGGGRMDTTAISPDLMVQAQEIELTQALVNLLRNAIAASPGAAIGLHVHDLRDEVRIEVSNPVDDPSSSSGTGMGVGLVIARTIVEAHGGTLVREDRAECVRFILSLPVLAPVLAGAAA